MLKCRGCGHKTTEVMDFGEVALAGAFLKPEQFSAEKKYRLSLNFCERCYLLQTGQAMNASELFERYFYFSSATETMRKHFERYAAVIAERFNPKEVLEIGCNDGVLMRPLQKLGIEVTGIDPAKNMASDNVITGFWSSDLARNLGQYDLVLANNVFAHIEDINDALEGITIVLSEGGSFIFEVNDLSRMISDLQYDWVYHEHVFYYSLMSLEKILGRHGLEVYDLSKIATHAGSVRYFVGWKGRHEITKNVSTQKENELWMKFDAIGRYEQFASDASVHSLKLLEIISKYRRVVGYGACGRTNTMLQFCGIDSRQIASIVDDAPSKHGFYTPGTHIPITDSLDKEADALIVFAWSFLSEIEPKLSDFGGKVYIPLPHIYEHKQAKAA